MACVRPLSAVRLDDGTVSLSGRVRASGAPLLLPCGQCVGCLLERSRVWAVRCMQEAQLYERNCFVTLTYDDEHLPAYGSLDRRDFQLFMKKLRRRYASEAIRFFHCGEYGARTAQTT